MMNEQHPDIDILIVGAGPVGLFLANECARRGLRWRLVEPTPRNRCIPRRSRSFPRTLEILDMAGLVDPFLRVANRVTSVAIVSHQRRLAHMRFRAAGQPVSVYRDGAAERHRTAAGRAPGATREGSNTGPPWCRPSIVADHVKRH